MIFFLCQSKVSFFPNIVLIVFYHICQKNARLFLRNKMNFSCIHVHIVIQQIKKRKMMRMTEEKNQMRVPHNIVMNDRKNLSLTGVEEVLSCDEEIVSVRTSMGELTISGMKLHIGSFNRASGELKLDGTVKELVYADIDPQRRGFFGRLLR